MKLHYIEGINGNRLEVTYNNTKLNYSFGYNCSSNRQNAEYAEEDHYKALKYNWEYKNHYKLKPYIGDIVKDIIETNYIKAEDIKYSGYNVFANKDITKEEVKEVFDRLFAEV